jgi:hypothetical protein
VLQTGESSGRYLANRLRAKLKKKVSAQVRAAANAGRPTLLVLYDNTPLKSSSTHSDVVQAMLGHHAMTICQTPGSAGPLHPLTADNEAFFEKTERAFRDLCDRARAKNELHFALSLNPEFRGAQDAGWSTD